MPGGLRRGACGDRWRSSSASDAYYVRAYPAATAEAWIDGHVHAFAFFGRGSAIGSLRLTTAVWCRASGGRDGSSGVSALPVALPRDVTGGPGKRRARWTVWLALPGATSWCRCRAREAFNRRRRSSAAAAGRWRHRRAPDAGSEAMAAPPSAPFEACAQARAGQLGSLSWSVETTVPVPMASVWVRGYVERVAGGEVSCPVRMSQARSSSHPLSAPESSRRSAAGSAVVAAGGHVIGLDEVPSWSFQRSRPRRGGREYVQVELRPVRR